MREEQDDASAIAAMDEFYESARDGRVSGALGRARRNIGREHFPTVARVMAEIISGRFNGYSDPPTSDADKHELTSGELVERALEIDVTPSHPLSAIDQSLAGSSEADFIQLSQHLRGGSIAAAARADSSQLDEARSELRSLIEVMTTIAPLFERFVGRGAIAMFAAVVRDEQPDHQAFGLLGWLVLRQEPSLRQGLLNIAATAPSARTAVNADSRLAELARAVPAFAPLVTDERLAAAQRDPAALAALNRELAVVRGENRPAIEEYLAIHPDVVQESKGGGDS